VAAYILLSLPLEPSYSWLFPKVWILLALFLFAGSSYWRNLRLRPVLAAMLAITVFAGVDAGRHQRSYNQEPARMFAPVELQPGSIYASNPTLSNAGIVYESLGARGYVLKTSAPTRSLTFAGHAFHPSTPALGSPIDFELVANGHSAILAFDPRTQTSRTIVPDGTNPVVSLDGHQLACISEGRLVITGLSGTARAVSPLGPVDEAAWFPDGSHLAFSADGVIYDSGNMSRLIETAAGDQSEPAVSPNGKSLAFTLTRHGIRHVWIQDIKKNIARELTAGSCNSYASAWEPDSKGLVFASDCGRGLGLPRLYRAELPTQ
jgi:Tol biopolymer transport system component